MIRSQGLTYRYPGAADLTFADVEVPQGTVLLLSGPSGCGKSTWLALAAALMQPTSGQLWVAGESLNGIKSAAADAWRARVVGFLPQKLHLSAAMTVAQNLAMAQWASGTAPSGARITQALHALGVADLAARLPAQLSGGQAQRVALARAVLLQPQVILADEPTASLDDEACADAVHLLLATAQAQDATLVIASHDARVAQLIPPDIEGKCGFQRLQLLRRPL